MRLLLLLLTLLMPTLVQAACSGKDLRQQISPQTAARLEQAVARVPFAQGNHWVAQKGGQKIHIIGTMHLGDSRMHAVMRRLKPIIKTSDVVFLEQIDMQSDVPQEQIVHSFKENFFLPEGVFLPSLLTRNEWEKIEYVAPFIGIPRDIAPFLQPWIYSYHFSASNCGVRGITSRRGLDDRILRYASKRRIPLGGLENAETGLAAFSGRALKDQVKQLRMDMHSAIDLDNLAVTMREAYFEENLTQGWLLSRWLQIEASPLSTRESQRLLDQRDRRLHDDRNLSWLPILLRRKEATIFVAVGAAHLPGKNGLLNLLHQRGFTLTRAPF